VAEIEGFNILLADSDKSGGGTPEEEEIEKEPSDLMSEEDETEEDPNSFMSKVEETEEESRMNAETEEEISSLTEVLASLKLANKEIQKLIMEKTISLISCLRLP
jgi:hypothetical protein